MMKFPDQVIFITFIEKIFPCIVKGFVNDE